MSPLTGLLQFVPNIEIANKFLESEFCLKDILSYKQKDFKSDCCNNVKYDNLEGKILTTGIIEKCCFISCFTMLNDSFFEKNPPYKLKKEIIEGLEKGNVSEYGKMDPRPFITIKRANVEPVVDELCVQSKSFLKSINYNGPGFSTKAVLYLELEDYLKRGSEAQEKLNNIRSSNEKVELININNLTDQQKTDLCDALKFMYFTKLKKYQVQNEYRMHIISDDPLPEKYLVNGLLRVPIKKNLHNYIKVHKVHDDIYNLTKYDL
ncbi:hypothetical protein SAMN04487792_0413 [Lactobacillus bombicola]|uniref:Uncharacterized protein n=1 Tax=Lactobacillus bombicola TaxID=1505723 RepID=A0A1I1RLW9_9LACO|nr:hypothetical protein [Lactobacillus bombicola]SFD35142.1 hypothetical protein SAMN04487792_0413 [Lactobacillus bombicola]